MHRFAAPFVALVYALLVIILAIMGYQAGSLTSLVMGGTTGILLLICIIFMFKELRWAYLLGILFTVILLMAFGFRFRATTDFMPGAMSIFSGIVLVMLLVQAVKLSHR